MNPDNDNGDADSASTRQDTAAIIFVILGKAWKDAGGPALGLHVILAAPDDDCAVRHALEALQAEGFAEVEFDRIGMLDQAPTTEPHASAWAGALNGEVAIINFDEIDDEDDED